MSSARGPRIGRKAGRYHHRADETISPSAEGPKNCLRTAQTPAACRACGAAMVTVRHMPLRVAGTYCRACCPCCANGTDGWPTESAATP